MATWFLAKIKFLQEDEKGISRSIQQAYLFDAVSYTDAEARAYDHLAGEVPDFQLVGLTKVKINDIYFEENNAELWFRCRVSYIVFDEKTNKEKQVPYVFYLNAHNIKEAYAILEAKLGSIQDYVITEISATKILDVIPYEEAQLEENMQEVPTHLKPLKEVLEQLEN